VTSKAFNIGRHWTNDIILEDLNASSQHCRITQENGAWVLEDLGSANGTIVNDLTLNPGRIRFSSSIAVRIGTSHLSIEALAPVSAAEKAEPRTMYGLVAESHALRSALEFIPMFGPAKHLVLIQGEPGSGKESIARALHDASDRKNGPYVTVDVGTLSAPLIESELFGHVKGAFTGAFTRRRGAFEEASGGTLFLDEIGELPLELQPKLLRVLECYAIRRMGEMGEAKVDTRVVAATNRDLYAMVQRGEFRRDLYDRLFVLVIQIPPLRERPEDIMATARFFLRRMRDGVRLSYGAEEALTGHAWPGNVRELLNVLQRALAIAKDNIIRSSDLRFAGDEFTGRFSDTRNWYCGSEARSRAATMDALEVADGNKTRAAELLGVSRQTIINRIKRFGIEEPGGKLSEKSPAVRQTRAEDRRPKRRSASSDTQMSRATELVDCHPRSSADRSGPPDEAPTRPLHVVRNAASDRHRPARLDSRGGDEDVDLSADDVD
jgi:DNA-binding NtrC family response regulator